METLEVAGKTFVELITHPVDTLLNPGRAVKEVLNGSLEEKTVISSSDIELYNAQWDAFYKFREALTPAEREKQIKEINDWLSVDHNKRYMMDIQRLGSDVYKFEGDLAKIKKNDPVIIDYLKEDFGGKPIQFKRQAERGHLLDYYQRALEGQYNAYIETVNWKNTVVDAAAQGTPSVIGDTVKKITGIDISNPNVSYQNPIDLLFAILSAIFGTSFDFKNIGLYIGIGLLVLLLVTHFINKL